MKKGDIIQLVKEIIKEMRPPYGSHDNFQPTGQRRNLSGYPGVMEGDALINSGIEAYKKIQKISPNNSLKGAYARELRGILGSDDINDYEFDNIKTDNEGNPIDLSSEQAIALTRIAKDVRVPFTIEDNPEMYRENKNMKNIKEYGSAPATSPKQKLVKYVSTDGSSGHLPVASPEEMKALEKMKNIDKVEMVEETEFTNDIGKDDYMDDEGRFAKSQMHKMAHYAEKLSSMLHDMDQLPAWVQSKITKASDYMSMVYHYLEYEFARQDDNLMEHLDKHNKRALLMEGAMKKFFEAFDKGLTDEEIIQDYAKRGTQIPETFVSKARKQYEGLKKMKLELEMSEKEFKNSARDIVNNPGEGEVGMEPVEEKHLASGLFKEGSKSKNK